VSIKSILSETAIMLLLVISVPLSTSILHSNLPSLVHYQQAMAQKTAAATAMPNFLMYRNSIYGINVQYPSNWLGNENTLRINNNSSQVQNIVTFVPQNKSIHAFVTIGAVNLPPKSQSIRIDMSSFASLVIDNIKQSTPGFQLIESKATTVKAAAESTTGKASGGGININDAATSAATTTIPAQKIVYTADGPIHNTMAVYAIKGDKAFFISYFTETESTYLNYLPIAQKMMDSFQIVNAKTTTTSSSAT
jgi:hypothetical protein